MAKSKSTTFKKGTDIDLIAKWVTYHAGGTGLVFKTGASSYSAINSKVRITVTKLPEKGEKEE